MPDGDDASGSWIRDVWRARELGLLSNVEAWDIVLAAREAPDPAASVAFVLRALEAAHRPAVVPEAIPDEVVITDL